MEATKKRLIAILEGRIDNKNTTINSCKESAKQNLFHFLECSVMVSLFFQQSLEKEVFLSLIEDIKNAETLSEIKEEIKMKCESLTNYVMNPSNIVSTSDELYNLTSKWKHETYLHLIYFLKNLISTL